jgi:hypothetical protein
MAQFEQLQELWQKQQILRVADLDPALVQAFRRFGRRQDWINAGKLVLVSLILGQALAFARHSFWMVVGLAVVAAGAYLMLVLDWRSQRAIARLDFAAPSVDFVRDAIARLKNQWQPFGRNYWIFLGCFVAGTNLTLLGALHTRTPLMRLVTHLAGSVLPCGGYEIGRRIRRIRFEHECRPLLDRLAALQSALGERPNER